MLSIFVVFFNLIIFVFVAGIIAKNIINVKNISESFKNMYKNDRHEDIYNYMNQNYNQTKQQDNVSFDSSIKMNNNPIKEKKGKRGSI